MKPYPLTALLCLTAAGCARNVRPEFNLFGGYSNVQQDDSSSLYPPIVDTKGGGRFAVGLQGPVGQGDYNDSGAGLQLGGRVSFSYYRQDVGERRVAGEPLLTIQDYSDLSVILPQATVSYRGVFGDPYDGAFFVEPGVGVGPAVGVAGFNSELQFDDNTLAVDNGYDYQTKLSYGVNPFLRLGYANDRLTLGGEGGYQFTGLDFDQGLGKNAREWYVGLFVGVRVGQ